jgi:hypothetical protein
MLFKLADDTPIFQVFKLLNEELCNFIANCVSSRSFDRNLFSAGAIGQACWNNSNTKESFEKLHSCLNAEESSIRTQLRDCVLNNQDLGLLFQTPPSGLLDFLHQHVCASLKGLATQLYDHTKGLRPVEIAAGGNNISAHFSDFRDRNGNVCKACGMEKLAAIRAGISDRDQWRADYDHQLCKTKYPIFAVHPQNMVPLCSVCNQDAKRAKDLFKSDEGVIRKAFFPYTEEASSHIQIRLTNERDPNPEVAVKWDTTDPNLLEKLATWDDVYQIKSRVLGEFRSIDIILLDAFEPRGFSEFSASIMRSARQVDTGTLKRKPYAFWNHKLCEALSSLELEPFWQMVEFARESGEAGADYIMS